MLKRKTSQGGPLVSCLCITKNSLNNLKRAILCFVNQSYKNRELIIVYEGRNRGIEKIIGSYPKRARIKAIIVPIAPKRSLGELRNLSISHAKGKYFCQWDDDDWYHRDRIEIQIRAVIKNDHVASILNYFVIFDGLKKQAYFSKYRLWEGSILCKRSIYPDTQYPPQAKSEDSSFLYQLIRKERVFPIAVPNLYIYVFHGNNTWDSVHFDKIFEVSQKLSFACSKLISDILKGKFSVRNASRLLASAILLSEINYLYANKILLLQQDSKSTHTE